MNPPSSYEAIPGPRTAVCDVPAPRPSWLERVGARLPARRFSRVLLALLVALAAVALTVSYNARASVRSRSFYWPAYPVDRASRIGHGYNSYSRASLSYTSSPFVDVVKAKWKFGGRCFRKCGKLPGPKVCCALDGDFRKKRNTCACECQGGDVVSNCNCLCKKAKGGPVCCSTPDGPVDTSSACACECKPDSSVLSEGECPVVEPPPKVCACPKIYAPVCCETPSGLETAGNACECLCQPESIVLSNGECEATLTLPTNATEPATNVTQPSTNVTAPPTNVTEPPPPTCSCPLIYDPVCCKTPVGNTTVPNACMCTCQNKVVSEGQCGTVRALFDREPVPCACPLIYAPVCCMTPSGTQTVSNACFCECETGSTVLAQGACDAVPNLPRNVSGPPPPPPPLPSPSSSPAPAPAPAPCVCPLIYAPVCCKTPYGTRTLPNRCMCECQNSVISKGECV